MVIVVMGVSGVGKTTIGQQLAAAQAWQFIDADDLHPEANRQKMASGQPLTDADRWPWLALVRQQIEAASAGVAGNFAIKLAAKFGGGIADLGAAKTAGNCPSSSRHIGHSCT